jgi:hypothetical protein
VDHRKKTTVGETATTILVKEMEMKISEVEEAVEGEIVKDLDVIAAVLEAIEADSTEKTILNALLTNGEIYMTSNAIT